MRIVIKLPGRRIVVEINELELAIISASILSATLVFKDELKG